MTDIYPYPTENATQDLTQIVLYTNNVTGGIFFPLLLLALYIIIFVSTIYFGAGKAFTYSSLTCSLLSIFLVISDLLNPMYMYFLFFLTAAGFLILRMNKGYDYPQI